MILEERLYTRPEDHKVSGSGALVHSGMTGASSVNTMGCAEKYLNFCTSLVGEKVANANLRARLAKLEDFTISSGVDISTLGLESKDGREDKEDGTGDKDMDVELTQDEQSTTTLPVPRRRARRSTRKSTTFAMALFFCIFALVSTSSHASPTAVPSPYKSSPRRTKPKAAESTTLATVPIPSMWDNTPSAWEGVSMENRLSILSCLDCVAIVGNFCKTCGKALCAQ